MVTRLVVPLSLTLAAIWTLLGAGIHRDGMGGQVVWFLPGWSTDTSGEFGGAVTTGQLHFAAARGAQALAVVAILVVLLQVVSAHGWLRLAVVMWGRAARAFGPMFCLGEAYAAERADSAAGSPFRFPQSRGDGACRRPGRIGPATVADDWFAHHDARGSGARAIIGFVLALGLCLWWATAAIDPDGWPGVSGTERTLIALAAFLLVGLLLRGAALPRLTTGDLVPVIRCARRRGLLVGP
ncbi:hypothetical protein [Nocardioides alcanivorans]|uniref:hypothetical protein n=1 Tax=Nocardioides alcanivorans TaxID=2897352 RepID=UPI001F25FF19|nr:hypothetical protein [Nocardioides alcanivorans]